METIIRLRPSELDEALLDKIKKYIGEKDNVDVIISLKEYNADYAEALNRSVEQAERGDLISFRFEDFMAYQPASKEGQ